MTQKALLVCGVLSSLVYLSFDLGALRWHGYSIVSQTISELAAIGAPSRSLVVPLGIAYDVLLIAFGVGVWQLAGRKRELRFVGSLLVAIGVTGFLAPFFAMHVRGAEKTLTDTMHVILASVQALLILLAVGFGAAAFGTRFRWYSIATIVILLLFGALAGSEGPRIAANLPTPRAGVFERMNIGAYLLWVVVLAITLLRLEETATRDGLGTRMRITTIPFHDRKPLN